MKVATSITIAAPVEAVWQAVINIEQAADMVSGIRQVEVLHKPEQGMVGFKWRETRIMFGKEATEDMWITDCVTNDYYATRAENHGAVYLSRISVQAVADGTRLTMGFESQAQTLFARLMSSLMVFFIKGSIIKEFDKDLVDIKAFVEQPPND